MSTLHTIRIWAWLCTCCFLLAACTPSLGSDLAASQSPQAAVNSTSTNAKALGDVDTTASPTPLVSATASATLIPQAPLTLTPDITNTQTPRTNIVGMYGFSTDSIPSGYYFLESGVAGVLRNVLDLRVRTNDFALQANAPGNALYLEFSHFADRLAYWSQPEGKLWVSDLAYTIPHLLFDDIESVYPSEYAYYPYEEIDLTWSPDDLHLIVDVPENRALNMIYHVQTDTLEAWPYVCNLVAISPNSQRLATWCKAIQGDNSYAVIEWGGEIWYSQAAPAQVLVQRGEDKHQTWVWSADGGQIAYFDHKDPEGDLHISDSSGKQLLKALPGGAYWMSASGFRFPSAVEPLAPPLIWSEDASKLVVYANGDQCLLYHKDSGEDVKYPCWQVVNTRTGKVVWSNKAIAELEALTPYEKILLFSTTISPDGRWLILSGFCASIRETYVIDLDEQKIVDSFNIQFDIMRWGLSP